MDTNNRLTVMDGGMETFKSEKRTMFHHLSAESPKPTGNPLKEEDAYAPRLHLVTYS